MDSGAKHTPTIRNKVTLHTKLRIDICITAKNLNDYKNELQEYKDNENASI